MTKTSVYENEITTGPIWKQLLYFFFPILLGTFFQQLYNTADAMIVGNFVGKEALAAVGGTTSVLINFLLNLFVGVSSGATVIIAQYYGAQKLAEVHRAVHTAIALSLVSGAAITLLGLLFAPQALRLMGAPEEIMEYALTYLRIYFTGTIASCIYNIGSGILRATGDTRRPLYFLIASCLTNILLDLLFVVGFGWKVMGVAAATVLSQVVSAVLVGIVLLRTSQIYRVTLREIRFHRQILKDIIRVGLPAGIQSDMYTISNMLIQSSINSFGTNIIAAWTAYGKIDGFFWMISGAFGLAITTFVGQNFGARKYDRIRGGIRQCSLMFLGTAVVVSLLFVTFSKPLLQLFTSDDQVLREGIHMMRLLTPFYAAFIPIEVLSGAIRGTGDSLIPTLMTGGGVCALRVVWILVLLPLFPMFDMVVYSYPVTWVITSILFIIYYLHGGWLRRQIARADAASEPGEVPGAAS